MSDISHIWGQDLQLRSDGDLLIAAGATLATQRLLRRLMTNLSGYIWHPEYGAGLPTYVGETLHEDTLRAIVLKQCLLEDSVAKDPPPVVTITDGGTGTVYLRIQYTYAPDASAQAFSFGLGG